MLVLSTKTIRDAIISTVLITTALILIFLQLGEGGPVKKRTNNHQKQHTPIPASPVRSAFTIPNWADVQTRVSLPPVQASNKQAIEETQELEAEHTQNDPKLTLEQREQLDRKWRDLAKRKADELYRYAELIPSEDAEYFNHIVNHFLSASKKGIYREEPVLHEGDFFNRLFFAAGRWGKAAGFRRGWVYLLRSIGCKLEPAGEHSVVELVNDIFTQGLKTTKVIETDVLGAPLEGGNPEYWNKVGLPPMKETQLAWKMRNEQCLSLYYDFLNGLEARLSKEHFEKVCTFFDLFNLSP